MKITVKKLPLKKKTYEVKRSVKNMRKTYKMQLAFAENTDMDGKDNKEIMAGVVESFDVALNYIKDILKLSDKDVDKIEDELDQNQLFEVANKVAMDLMGVKPEDLDDPKK